MFGSLGVPELIFIFVLALLIFGPRKLPEIGRTIGRGLAEFRKASTDLKRSLNAEMIEEEMRQSDPRKILRDDPVAEPAKASRPAAPAPEEKNSSDTESGAPGTVSRGSVVEPDAEDAAGDEAASRDDTPAADENLAESKAQ